MAISAVEKQGYVLKAYAKNADGTVNPDDIIIDNGDNENK